MEIKESNLFKRDITKLKIDIFSQINKTLELLEENPNHPSLHNKNIKCKRATNMYSIRINKQYRLLYLKYDDYIDLHRLLDHDKYDRLTKDC
jgi:mRNA-degrading endonuclease RelE of RelBE toxin-antitoxin system